MMEQEPERGREHEPVPATLNPEPDLATMNPEPMNPLLIPISRPGIPNRLAGGMGAYYWVRSGAIFCIIRRPFGAPMAHLGTPSGCH